LNVWARSAIGQSEMSRKVVNLKVASRKPSTARIIALRYPCHLNVKGHAGVE
jgi:hypothetical protein